MPNGCSATIARKSAPTIVPALDAADRRAPGAQSLQPRLRRPRRLPGQRPGGPVGDGRPPRIHRAGRHGRAATGCRGGRRAVGQGRGREPIPVRRWRAMSRCPPAARSTLLWLLGDAGSAEEASALVAAASGEGFRRAPGPERQGMGRLPRRRCRSRRRTRRSMRWSITGCPTRALPAASGRARPSIRRAAPSASATSFRIRWRFCCTIRSSRATRSSMPRGGNSRKATCSIGGCRAPAPASAP